MKKTNHGNINTAQYWSNIYGDAEKRKDYAGTGTSLPTHKQETNNRFKFAGMEVKNGQKVIDIGCGVGVFTEHIKNTYPDCEVWGVDISHTVIDVNKAKRKDITYLQEYVGALDDIPNNYFDVVFSGETLEHLDNPYDLLNDAHKILKKGGKLIITTPFEDRINSPEHVFEFNKQDLTEMYEATGFSKPDFVDLPKLEYTLVIFAVGYKL